MEVNKIICGPALEVLKAMPDESISCAISSPPYWALRDYGVDGQLGLEKTFEEYIDKLCTIYDEVRRVLRPDGTCWVNLGDTYSRGTRPKDGTEQTCSNREHNQTEPIIKPEYSISDKSLCLIPQRFAIGMVNRGWILRNVLIWHKPNPMPCSAKDRFTVDFEYVYFFVKNKKYWFEPQYEPSVDPESYTGRRPRNAGTMAKYDRKNYKFAGSIKEDGKLRSGQTYFGRNKRCVLTIPTQPFPDAHFATFPEKLVEPMIKAGCPEFICTKCGKPREKIWEPTEEYAKYLNTGKPTKKNVGDKYVYMKSTPALLPDYRVIGYTDCGCNADWRPGVVLDMFRGNGRSSNGKIAA